MIDINYARNQFEEYLNGYDRTDDKIHLKEVHTFCGSGGKRMPADIGKRR